MKRLLCRGLLLGLVTLVLASPALAVFNQDPGTGGNPASCPPNDQCCVCTATANQTYNKCVKDNCSWMSGPAKALCIQQCSSVRDQDIIKCTIDGKCA